MRTLFTAVLLLLSVFYAALAFGELDFLSARGRIGPGFFPQIIGALLVALTLSTAIGEYRRRDTEPVISADWQVTVAVGAMLAVLIVASHTLGALPGMVIFMLLALFVLNRGRPLTNILIGVLLPAGLFALFRYSLNASMPPGMIGMPY